MTLKHFRSAYALLALLMLLASVSEADDDDFGSWLIVSTTDRIAHPDGDGRWRYAFDAQYRWFDRADGVEQYLLRPAVGYDLAPGLSAWLGYAFVKTHRHGGGNAREQRIWQQLAWQFDGRAKSRWLLRGRLEERRFDGADDTGLTLRLMLRGKFPLTFKPGVDLVLAMEPFFDLKNTDWGADPGLAQLRSAVGLAFTINPKLGLEVGYLNQYVPRSQQIDLANHLLYANFQLKF
ncbi:MAG TPA: DUF2490 domain-containing protein [Woeseiaceae bacterium]|nr:DUF2490 domain-containing protein [Woeseiaceae bacterium]